MAEFDWVPKPDDWTSVAEGFYKRAKNLQKGFGQSLDTLFAQKGYKTTDVTEQYAQKDTELLGKVHEKLDQILTADGDSNTKYKQLHSHMKATLEFFNNDSSGTSVAVCKCHVYLEMLRVFREITLDDFDVDKEKVLDALVEEFEYEINRLRKNKLCKTVLSLAWEAIRTRYNVGEYASIDMQEEDKTLSADALKKLTLLTNKTQEARGQPAEQREKIKQLLVKAGFPDSTASQALALRVDNPGVLRGIVVQSFEDMYVKDLKNVYGKTCELLPAQKGKTSLMGSCIEPQLVRWICGDLLKKARKADLLLYEFYKDRATAQYNAAVDTSVTRADVRSLINDKVYKHSTTNVNKERRKKNALFDFVQSYAGNPVLGDAENDQKDMTLIKRMQIEALSVISTSVEAMGDAVSSAANRCNLPPMKESTVLDDERQITYDFWGFSTAEGNELNFSYADPAVPENLYDTITPLGTIDSMANGLQQYLAIDREPTTGEDRWAVSIENGTFSKVTVSDDTKETHTFMPVGAAEACFECVHAATANDIDDTLKTALQFVSNYAMNCALFDVEDGAAKFTSGGTWEAFVEYDTVSAKGPISTTLKRTQYRSGDPLSLFMFLNTRNGPGKEDSTNAGKKRYAQYHDAESSVVDLNRFMEQQARGVDLYEEYVRIKNMYRGRKKKRARVVKMIKARETQAYRNLVAEMMTPHRKNFEDERKKLKDDADKSATEDKLKELRDKFSDDAEKYRDALKKASASKVLEKAATFAMKKITAVEDIVLESVKKCAQTFANMQMAPLKFDAKTAKSIVQLSELYQGAVHDIMTENKRMRDDWDKWGQPVFGDVKILHDSDRWERGEESRRLTYPGDFETAEQLRFAKGDEVTYIDDEGNVAFGTAKDDVEQGEDFVAVEGLEDLVPDNKIVMLAITRAADQSMLAQRRRDAMTWLQLLYMDNLRTRELILKKTFANFKALLINKLASLENKAVQHLVRSTAKMHVGRVQDPSVLKGPLVEKRLTHSQQRALVKYLRAEAMVVKDAAVGSKNANVTAAIKRWLFDSKFGQKSFALSMAKILTCIGQGVHVANGIYPNDLCSIIRFGVEYTAQILYDDKEDKSTPLQTPVYPTKPGLKENTLVSVMKDDGSSEAETHPSRLLIPGSEAELPTHDVLLRMFFTRYPEVKPILWAQWNQCAGNARPDTDNTSEILRIVKNQMQVNSLVLRIEHERTALEKTLQMPDYDLYEGVNDLQGAALQDAQATLNREMERNTNLRKRKKEIDTNSEDLVDAMRKLLMEAKDESPQGKEALRLLQSLQTKKRRRTSGDFSAASSAGNGDEDDNGNGNLDGTDGGLEEEKEESVDFMETIEDEDGNNVYSGLNVEADVSRFMGTVEDVQTNSVPLKNAYDALKAAYKAVAKNNFRNRDVVASQEVTLDKNPDLYRDFAQVYKDCIPEYLKQVRQSSAADKAALFSKVLQEVKTSMEITNGVMWAFAEYTLTNGREAVSGALDYDGNVMMGAATTCVWISKHKYDRQTVGTEFDGQEEMTHTQLYLDLKLPGPQEDTSPPPALHQFVACVLMIPQCCWCLDKPFAELEIFTNIGFQMKQRPDAVKTEVVTIPEYYSYAYARWYFDLFLQSKNNLQNAAAQLGDLTWDSPANMDQSIVRISAQLMIPPPIIILELWDAASFKKSIESALIRKEAPKRKGRDEAGAPARKPSRATTSTNYFSNVRIPGVVFLQQAITDKRGADPRLAFYNNNTLLWPAETRIRGKGDIKNDARRVLVAIASLNYQDQYTLSGSLSGDATVVLETLRTQLIAKNRLTTAFSARAGVAAQLRPFLEKFRAQDASTYVIARFERYASGLGRTSLLRPGPASQDEQFKPYEKQLISDFYDLLGLGRRSLNGNYKQNLVIQFLRDRREQNGPNSDPNPKFAATIVKFVDDCQRKGYKNAYNETIRLDNSLIDEDPSAQFCAFAQAYATQCIASTNVPDSVLDEEVTDFVTQARELRPADTVRLTLRLGDLDLGPGPGPVPGRR